MNSTNISELLAKIDLISQKSKDLKDKYKALEKKFEALQKELFLTKQENKKLRDKNIQVSTLNNMLGGDEEKKKVEQKIESLIEEIDLCLNALKV